jgi:hypothetical protein
MRQPVILLSLSNGGMKRNVHVKLTFKERRFCSFVVTDEDGYLFTLIPTDCPFTDFRISDRDIEFDQPVEWPLVDKVKTTIINHFM